MSNSSPLDVVDIEHTFFSDVDHAARQSLTCAAHLRDRLINMFSERHISHIIPQMMNQEASHKMGVTVFEKSLSLFQGFFTADHPSDISVRVHVVSEAVNHMFWNTHLWTQFLSHPEINQSRSQAAAQFKEELRRLEELRATYQHRDYYESDNASRHHDLENKIKYPPVGKSVSVDQCIDIFWRLIDDGITNNIENTLSALSLPRWKPLAVNVADTLEVEVSKMEKQKLENYQRQQKAEHAASPSRRM